MRRFVLPPRKRREITPSQLPLDEQAALFYEIQRKRRQSPPVSWKRIADEEGFAERTLEYFNRSWTRLEENRDTRSVQERLVERFRDSRQPSPASPDPRPSRQEGQDAPPESEEDGRRIEAKKPQPVEERQAGEAQHESETGQGVNMRQVVELMERLEENREAAQKREEELRDALWARSIAARQVLGPWLEQLREAALRREEEGLPPDDEEADDGEPWDKWWGPMPMP
jgi:hypothetical protein